LAKSRERLVAEWGQRLKRLGLADITQALLPVIKPAGPLVSQAMWGGQPFVNGLAIESLWGDLALLLEDPGALDGLEQQLKVDDALSLQ
jgi:hypothetical protein